MIWLWSLSNAGVKLDRACSFEYNWACLVWFIIVSLHELGCVHNRAINTTFGRRWRFGMIVGQNRHWHDDNCLVFDSPPLTALLFNSKCHLRLASFREEITLHIDWDGLIVGWAAIQHAKSDYLPLEEFVVVSWSFFGNMEAESQLFMFKAEITRVFFSWFCSLRYAKQQPWSIVRVTVLMFFVSFPGCGGLKPHRILQHSIEGGEGRRSCSIPAKKTYERPSNITDLVFFLRLLVEALHQNIRHSLKVMSYFQVQPIGLEDWVDYCSLSFDCVVLGLSEKPMGIDGLGDLRTPNSSRGGEINTCFLFTSSWFSVLLSASLPGETLRSWRWAPI